MTPKEVLIDLLAKSIHELPDKTVEEIKTLLEREVGPLCDDSRALAEARDAVKAAAALNDEAEALFGKISHLNFYGREASIRNLPTDNLRSRLRTAREKAGRPEPK